MASDAADDSKVSFVKGVNISLAIVTTMAVAGRVWTNMVTLRTLRLDDGFGTHFRDVNPDTLNRYLLVSKLVKPSHIVGLRNESNAIDSLGMQTLT
ncbi:uncharacterized protein PpBr36_11089 [Pyricularia pennisetigena]|uniref:uncharacterized protein n=1 Tax=Pyricularia pennisetigena TaxID=1578925 RepID=UPI001152C8FD|nr:uncharacterized protein PpBr36_11089 [Pyricularia pennisetigena]TLS20600.1 hypothetical protein PpBr36_11089 [Pyricularia pennisetigena]